MACHPSPSTKIPARSARFLAAFTLASMLFALGQFHRTSGSVLSSVFAADFALRSHQIGVVIGITAIVGMTSLIRGFDQSLRNSIRELGPNTIFVAKFSGLSFAAGNTFAALLRRPNLTVETEALASRAAR